MRCASCSTAPRRPTPTMTGSPTSWDFGDGSTGAGAVVEHTYATGGIYPVLLTVDDGRGLSNSKSSDAMTVRINRSPQAVAGDNKRACIGDVVVFDGSSSSDPDNGLLRYKWEFGDGASADIVNPTKTYAAPGSYRVELQVTDEFGLAERQQLGRRAGLDPAGAGGARRHGPQCLRQHISAVRWPPIDRCRWRRQPLQLGFRRRPGRRRRSAGAHLSRSRHLSRDLADRGRQSRPVFADLQ